MQDKKMALKIAEGTLEMAINKIENVKSEEYPQFKSILELMK
jgi:hypothetical protein